jgi:hypothetical protein
MLTDERRPREAVTVRIKVEYDAYNRTCKLLDREFGSALQDGGLYDLEIPVNVPDLLEDEVFALTGAPVAYA